jgi:hypothetical protein
LQFRLQGEAIRATGGDGDRRAGRGQRARKVDAQTRRGAGDQGHLA